MVPGNQLIAGRYQLLRELGRGGMGVVWEGRDTLLNRPIAVKEVLLQEGLTPAEQESHLVRTAREARTAARLNHPSVVAIYDVVEEDGRPWIIMELVRARSVEQVVASTGALPVRQAADVGRQVLSALRAAHEAGILHRDVKPSNILLTDDGRAVLTDFGIAVAEGDSSLTKTGMVTGSPSFLAPERVRAAEAGPASDLWSLGATLFASLVGRSPFERGDPMSTLTALLSEEPDYRRIPPIMHPPLQGLLRKEAADRVDAAEADRLLAAVIAGRPDPGAKHAVERKGRAGRTLLAIAAAVVVVGGGGTVAYLTLSEPTGATPRVTPQAAVSPLPSTAAPTPSATPTPTPTPTVTRVVPVVRGWTSPDGWSIQRPVGWRGGKRQAYAQWTRPDRSAHVDVQSLYATDDVNQILDGSELQLQESAQIRTLRKRAITHQGGKGLDWEFTWTAGQGGERPWAAPGQRYHEVQRALVIGDRAFLLSWTTTEAQWQRNSRLMRQVIDSFTVGG